MHILMQMGQYIRRSMGVQVLRGERTPIMGAHVLVKMPGGRKRMVF